MARRLSFEPSPLLLPQTTTPSPSPFPPKMSIPSVSQDHPEPFVAPNPKPKGNLVLDSDEEGEEVDDTKEIPPDRPRSTRSSTAASRAVDDRSRSVLSSICYQSCLPASSTPAERPRRVVEGKNKGREGDLELTHPPSFPALLPSAVFQMRMGTSRGRIRNLDFLNFPITFWILKDEGQSVRPEKFKKLDPLFKLTSTRSPPPPVIFCGVQ